MIWFIITGDDRGGATVVPFDEWDKLKYQANIVLEENAILSDQVC